MLLTKFTKVETAIGDGRTLLVVTLLLTATEQHAQHSSTATAVQSAAEVELKKSQQAVPGTAGVTGPNLNWYSGTEWCTVTTHRHGTTVRVVRYTQCSDI